MDSFQIVTSQSGSAGNPIGSIMAWPSNTSPGWAKLGENWLLCNGSSFDVGTYPKLYEVLGINTLPNLTDDRFLEGASTAGISYDAGLPNIMGAANVNYVNAANGAFYISNVFDAGWGYFPGFQDMETVRFDASRSNEIYGHSKTVQPQAYSVKFYIRAK